MKYLVKVKPGAKENKVGQEGDTILVSVTAPPEKGKANKAVVEVLSEHFKVPKSKIKIKLGHKTKNKLVEIS